MRDCIYRDEALKAVGKASWAGFRLAELPAADVVAVVCCRECKHAIDDGENNYWCNGLGWPMRLMLGDDYCSRGEKKGAKSDV